MLRAAGRDGGGRRRSARPTRSGGCAPGPLRLGDFTVEPDLSNAGPFLAAALVTGGSVTIRDWPADVLQAADAILDVITRMGAVGLARP